MNRAPALTNALDEMIGELESHRLLVVLVPAPRPQHAEHMIRVRADRNPLWYRALCGRHLRARFRRNPRPDTVLNRRDILSILYQLKAGASASRYAEELLAEAQARVNRNPAAYAA